MEPDFDNLDGTPCPSCSSDYTVDVSPTRDMMCCDCGHEWVAP